MSKKLSVVERLWVVDNGSIYTADTIELKLDFGKRSIQVREAIAFNVGEKAAEHIVSLHNTALGLDRFSEFLSGNPDRFHVESLK